MKCGADSAVTNRNGDTPFCLARAEGREKVVKWLQGLETDMCSPQTVQEGDDTNEHENIPARLPAGPGIYAARASGASSTMTARDCSMSGET